jgi:hypothetical protein
VTGHAPAIVPQRGRECISWRKRTKKGAERVGACVKPACLRRNQVEQHEMLHLYEAIQVGVPKTTLLRMVTNIGIDTVAGAIPVVDDVFDMAWKANKKNATLLYAYFASQRTS